MSGVSRRLTLPDGRQLGYDLHGPPSGRPLMLFHGTPSSRCGWYVFGGQALARRLGVCVIAPDRPGLGDSDLQPGRRIADWPADVVALADSLGLDRFAVLGYSGGGPYAVACALQIGERLTAVGILGGTGPYDAPGASAGVHPTIFRFLLLARDRPQLAERAFEWLGELARRAPRWLMREMMTILQGPDGEVLARARVRQAVVRAYLEALRPGPQGVRVDTALMVSPWGIDPRAVSMPVHLWHGEEDRFVSPVAVHHLAELLPRAQARFYPDEGHVSLLVRHGEEILEELVGLCD